MLLFVIVINHMKHTHETIEVTFDLLATKKQRLINAVADTAITVILYLMALLVIVLLNKLADIDGPMFWLKHASGLETYLLYMALALLYYVICETSTGATLGKFITHTKVLTEDGQEPSFSTIIVRSLARLIPFEAFSFIGEYSAGWHDQLSKTVVVDIHKFDKEIRFKKHLEGVNYQG